MCALTKRWRTGDDHRQRDEIAPHGVEDETKRFERDRSEQRCIAGLGKDHRRRSALVLVEEQRVATLAVDRRAISEPKTLRRMRRDTQPGEDVTRNERVDRTRVHEKIDAVARLRINRIRD